MGDRIHPKEKTKVLRALKERKCETIKKLNEALEQIIQSKNQKQTA